MPEPPKESGTITRGYLFAEAINYLLHLQGDDNMLGMNANTYGPIFEETIEGLNRDGMDLHASTVWTTTVLRLNDDLKQKRENSPGDYFVLEPIRIKHLIEISKYLLEHPQVRDEFFNIEALQVIPNQE